MMKKEEREWEILWNEKEGRGCDGTKSDADSIANLIQQPEVECPTKMRIRLNSWSNRLVMMIGQKSDTNSKEKIRKLDSG